MKTVNVSELEGTALDWAVAKADGVDVRPIIEKRPSAKWEVWLSRTMEKYSPSTDWSQGGPLIEKYCMMVDVEVAPDNETEAKAHLPDGSHWTCFGPTPLIAVCRAIVGVHAKSNTVEVPEELLQ